MSTQERSQVRPLNALVRDPRGLRMQSKEVEGTPLPGDTACAGVDDSKAKTGDIGAKIYGFFAYEHTGAPDRPLNIDTPYKTGAHASIINGPGIILVCKTTTAAAKGQILEAGANGTLTPHTTGTPLAVAEETVNEAGKILVRSLI
ncbi:MAG: hypothetical protein FWC33_03580 [Candidatus Bathyarchaeota archaeon]|nr:hypothetical protein [Candidatus Termiticorpusculum sp.]